MKEKNEFSKRIVFIYNYFKSHCADFGVSKPTKEAFITFLGISRGKLQSWERGYWPKDEDLQSISQKMRLSFAWLAFGTGEPFDVQDTRPVQTAGMDAMQSATGHDIDPLRRMTQAIGIPEDAWSISDYLGIPAADAGAYIQKVMACRQSQPPQSLPLPELWREAARRRYGVTPAWLDSGLGRSHEARAEEEPQELRTLRGMVDMLTAHGGTNEQVQELILNYGKRGDAGAEAGDGTKREQSVRTAFL
ncbi:hypothetical protein HMPREF0178_03455 [Bilophila sp. 4_1_30]|uniref:hypothetical protein n=2 Tax=Bilophila TaxID=35832 RepID=UPI0002237CAE|nr:hypothetical protein [Bilophila sp. 4_1_30]EGW43677.1 hypothetical protein HMPREF0178_03455 [Bilophila sp. 4_1_30]